MDGGKRAVVWTPSGRDCLDEILQHIAADSPAAAAKVLEVVLAAAESLSVFSERGRVVPEVGSRSIRDRRSQSGCPRTRGRTEAPLGP